MMIQKTQEEKKKKLRNIKGKRKTTGLRRIAVTQLIIGKVFNKMQQPPNKGDKDKCNMGGVT